MPITYLDEEPKKAKITYLDEPITETKPKKDLYSAWGAEITPEMEQRNPYLSAIIKTSQRGILTPFLHFLNQAAANLPRAEARAMGYEYPQPETLPEKALTYPAGVAGIISSPIFRAISAVTKAGKVVAPATKLGERIARGAVGGALGGAAVTPTEDIIGLKQRAGQAGLGAVLGGLFGVGAGAVRKEQGIIKELKQLKKIRKEIKPYQEKYAPTLPKEETTRKIGEQISERRRELSHLKNNFNQIIDTEAKTNAVNIKPKLKEFNNNLSKSYDKGIDEIDSLINVQNKTANIGEVGTDWLENALNKVSNDPEAVTRISAAAQKQGFVVNEMLDDFGDKIYRVYHPQKMNETVSFRELINFKNMFKKNNLSSTAKSGVGFQRQDMAYRALQDSWGDFILKNYRLASNEPTEIATMFTQLQKEYAPLAQAKWQAFKIFKPYDIEAIDIQKGMKFFKDYTLNKGINELEGGSAKLLDMIEKGSEFSPGIGGDTSSRLKSLGDIKIKSEKDLTTFINGLLKQKEKVIDLLAQERELVNQRNNLLKILGYSVAGAGILGTGVKITGKILQEK